MIQTIAIADKIPSNTCTLTPFPIQQKQYLSGLPLANEHQRHGTPSAATQAAHICTRGMTTSEKGPGDDIMMERKSIIIRA